MIKERACLNCKKIFEGAKCPACNEGVFSEAFKGEVEIFNQDESLIAKNMRIKEKGKYAIKIR